tara:strand:- start:400 stop:1248 length:849 start_codon:yes stop_codon:yes gene_type:complete
MQILSIDIGIKNLAYCLLETVNDKTFTIVQWDIVNLCGEIPKCSYVMKNKKSEKPCTKKACLVKDDVYYCRTHAKKMNCIIENDTGLKSNTKIGELKQLADRYNIDISTLEKKDDIRAVIKQYIHDNIFLKIKKQNASELSLVDVGIAIANNLPQHFKHDNIDKVIIENQLSPLANRMKTVQGMVAQYFIMHNCKDIHFISATNKLKPFTTEKLNYNERKLYSTEITQKIISNKSHTGKGNNAKWQELFSVNSKKDDLADSFLQGIWFLHNNNLIDIQKIAM